MKAKEMIKMLQDIDQDRDLPVFFCNGSIYEDGLTNIGNVLSVEGHFIMITKSGKFGTK